MTKSEWNKLKSELRKMSQKRFAEWLTALPITPGNFWVVRAALAEVFCHWLADEVELDGLKRELFGAGMYTRKKPRT